jgi:hypothetical protein
MTGSGAAAKSSIPKLGGTRFETEEPSEPNVKLDPIRKTASKVIRIVERLGVIVLISFSVCRCLGLGSNRCCGQHNLNFPTKEYVEDRVGILGSPTQRECVLKFECFASRRARET